MHFLDTNIFLYSISGSVSEERKRSLSIDLLDRDDGALSVQVLQEFYVQATRSSRTKALPHDIAVALMRTWTRFAIQDITIPVVEHALHIKQRYQLSYWDSAIIAAASAIGCGYPLLRGLAAWTADRRSTNLQSLFVRPHGSIRARVRSTTGNKMPGTIWAFLFH